MHAADRAGPRSHIGYSGILGGKTTQGSDTFNSTASGAMPGTSTAYQATPGQSTDTVPPVVQGQVVPAPLPAVPTSAVKSKIAALKELKELLDSDVLTQSEFDEQKKEILARKDP